jgi:hypothetical protein
MVVMAVMTVVVVMTVVTVVVIMTGSVRPRPDNTAARPLREGSNRSLAAAVTTSLGIRDKE